ncbi:Nitrate/nitrite sensor protein NarX [Actinoalloteichus hoggarensis]|uniref:histidine kinase n=1 Tax=Actinoalloteichus hoggarensis TaxID=1470176 RepID=A0A221W551_9PSEU|nr:Nitrate/nitrite sensor protein NarX [Actinoalloteichus hoggarensis]
MRRHPQVFDAGVALLLFVGPLIVSRAVGHRPEWASGPPGWEPPFARAELNLGLVLVGAVGCAALVVRRRWPLPVLAVTTAAGAATLAIGEGPSPYLAPALVAAYTVATLTPRPRAWAAGAVAAAVLAGVSVFAAPSLVQGIGNPGVIAWVGIAVAVGDAVSSRRAYIAEVEERARRAEQNREEEAARRVVAERMRIARELHDVVAHHIAVIAVQAGVAEHLLTSQPAAAATAVGHIREAGHTVLAEMTTLLGVLRGAEEPVAATEPAPSLDRVSELVEAFAATGLRIELVTSGRPRPLPPAVDLAGYRIVQESLTNAHKHGRGATVTVRVEQGPAELVVEVRNGAPGSGAAARDSGAGSGFSVRGAARAGSVSGSGSGSGSEAGPGPGPSGADSAVSGPGPEAFGADSAGPGPGPEAFGADSAGPGPGPEAFGADSAGPGSRTPEAGSAAWEARSDVTGTGSDVTGVGSDVAGPDPTDSRPGPGVGARSGVTAGSDTTAAIGPAASRSADSGDEPGTPRSLPGAAGHGIVGMRERAVTVGGTLSAEPISGGGFRVLARLPIPSANAEETT